jgi:hypothetical protein
MFGGIWMEGCEGGEAIWKGCVGGYVSMVDENRSLSMKAVYEGKEAFQQEVGCGDQKVGTSTAESLQC